jgi:hypothetical protein
MVVSSNQQRQSPQGRLKRPKPRSTATRPICKRPSPIWSGCEVEPWRVYQIDDARAFLAESGIDVDQLAPQVDGKIASAFIRARRPEAKSCCGPTCCS